MDERNRKPSQSQQRWRSTWSWLRNGQAGLRGNRGFFVYLPDRGPSPWKVPTRMWRVLSARRSAEPVPLLYLLVAAVGTAIGLVLRSFTGIRWWIAPAALLTASWGFFLSSIWWRKQDGRAPLATDLLAVIAPKRGAERRRREDRARLLASPLPMIGVEGSAELPELLGYGGGREIDRLSTWYGEHWICAIAEAPSPSADSAESADERTVRNSLHGDLVSRRMSDLIESGAENDDPHAGFEEVLDGARELAWSSTTLRVDGDELEAWESRVFDLRACYADAGGWWITIIGPSEEPLPALARLTSSERERLLDAAAQLAGV